MADPSGARPGLDSEGPSRQDYACGRCPLTAQSFSEIPDLCEEWSESLKCINEKEFDLMRGLIYDRFGINLSSAKRSLLVGRLQKILRVEGFTSFEQYYDYLTADQSGTAISKLIDNISTNHTYFNREKAHFDYFRHTALPEVLRLLEKRRDRDLRIWCAGCSSGEEPYMLLMLMHEAMGAEYRQYNAGILATDISERILSAARAGIYSIEKIANLPEEKKKKYFSRYDSDSVQVVETLRNEAVFRRFNLMNTVFPFKKPFQIIFCRNVMIYFDQRTRDALVRRFHAAMEPGGYLFIGHSETLGREQPFYEYIMPAVYRRNR